jgi:hypothetical protein
METLLGWSPILLMIVLALIIFVIYKLLKSNGQKSQPSADLQRRVEKLEEENRLLKKESNIEN